MLLRLRISIAFCLFILPSCSNKRNYEDRNKNSFQGIVIKGKQEARQLNIPTANISVTPHNIPEGVYSCQVVIKDKIFNAMCYYDMGRPYILEAHIFDYNENLYNQSVSIYLKNFIRKPVKNISLKEVKSLIKQDIKSCREDFVSSRF